MEYPIKTAELRLRNIDESVTGDEIRAAFSALDSGGPADVTVGPLRHTVVPICIFPKKNYNILSLTDRIMIFFNLKILIQQLNYVKVLFLIQL